MLAHRSKPTEAGPYGSKYASQNSMSRAGENGLKVGQDGNTWTGEYLQDLRTNRPNRPNGVRPLPSRTESRTPRASVHLLERAASALGMYEPATVSKQIVPERSASAMGHRTAPMVQKSRTMGGTPLARPPMGTMRNVSGNSDKTTTTHQTSGTSNTKSSNSSADSNGRPYKIPYYERGQRWMEKQEMASLRIALDKKDLATEQKVYDSAQDEAAVLVWKHQNPGIPYPYPDQSNLRNHLRKGSHARSLSNTPYENLYVRKGGANGPPEASEQGHRTVSDSSQESNGSRSGRFSSLSFSMRSSRMFGRTESQRNRVTSKGSQKTIFQDPKDKIYEVKEDVMQTVQDSGRPLPLNIRPRNTSYGTKSIKNKISKIEEKSERSTPVRDVSIVDIHKNTPSQSTNAYYKVNKDLPQSPQELSPSRGTGRPNTRDGKEIKGEEIRSATSMSLRDRSPKLPMPTMVSDRPGRPIVSFKNDYKPRQKDLVHEISADPRKTVPLQAEPEMAGPSMPTVQIPIINVPEMPSIHISESPAIPSIVFPEETPAVNATSIPTISFNECSTPSIPAVVVPVSSGRPLPHPVGRNSPFTRPASSKGSASNTRSAPHWSPAAVRGSAQCAACALPIAGKIVSASSERFHPACFGCFCCGELLECVAFYPEPEKFRAERLARVQARLHGSEIPREQANFTEEDDGDDSLRFYCHLDFHERFSPRCKSCKTPIEGQIIVACGAEWHVGHFFCAECGDPFAADMPFVEKDGFAWCVNCHTKRFSGKCAGCRKPITDVVVSALGREWHEQCFCCKECGGSFDDGRFFTRGEDEIPVCVKCEERRLKA